MSTKIQEYAVKYLHDTMKMDNATIAKELKLKESDVSKILDKNPTNKQSSTKNLMINETSAKKSKNVSIMTQAASMQNDELIKNMNTTNRTQDCIHRPKNS